MAAAVALIGTVAGLVAALAPASQPGHLAMANDVVRSTAHQARGAGTPPARAAVQVHQATHTQAPAVQQARPVTKPAPALQPYQMYDSVTPGRIPSGKAVATYATGHFAVSAAQVYGRRWVVWIDTNGTDPANASVLDVEPGNVGPSAAAAWARARLSADPNAVARIYTMRSEWQAAKSAIATLPAWMQSHVKWWIADPTGVPHVVPGSNATQWYWGPNYDISTVNPGF
jgi:hypothetical protein